MPNPTKEGKSEVIEFKWECLDEFTDRAKVIGGWIVRSQWGFHSQAMVFINDPHHSWKIK